VTDSATNPKTFFIVLAWLVIVTICLLVWLPLSVWSKERLPRTIVFNDVLDRATFGVAERPWTISPSGIVGMRLTGCLIPLSTGTIEPGPGVVMQLDFEDFTTFQVDTHASRFGVSAPQVGGLRWEFIDEGMNKVVLVAGKVWLHITGDLVWRGDVQAPATEKRMEIPRGARGVTLTCAGKPEGSADVSYVTLVTAEPQQAPKAGTGPAQVDTALLDFGRGLRIVDPRLEAPRGRLTVGNRVVELGGGSEIVVKGNAFQLLRIRWATSAPPSLAVFIRGDSANVVMGEDQLAPSTLAVLAQEPRWTAFAAVLIVVLGALLGKLFEIAIPTK